MYVALRLKVVNESLGQSRHLGANLTQFHEDVSSGNHPNPDSANAEYNCPFTP